MISHPDAGKSTLTEALALHARVITEAGAIHGKSGRRATVSDWMEMEQARASPSPRRPCSSPYLARRHGLRDQPARHPGHADFSEDTYRVLCAVDSAVMLIDAAKGLEPQTLAVSGVPPPAYPDPDGDQQVGPSGTSRTGVARRDPGAHRGQAHAGDVARGHRGRFQGCAGSSYRQFHQIHQDRGRRHGCPRGAHFIGPRRGGRGVDWVNAVEECELLGRWG